METLKRNIAIVCGGDSSEHDVSIRSAQGIYSFFDKERYNVYLVVVKTGQDWHVNLPDGNTAKIDKNDFSFVHDGKAVVFDYAYITIHGAPGENGVMQGYFELLHIPYSTSGVLVEAMTFDKYVLNNYLRGWGINVAKSLLIRRGEENKYTDEFIEKEIGMPCFVKPAADGSSFGVSKVKNADQLAPALRVAFMESDEVMIEKYLPARINPDTAKRVAEEVSRIYDILHCNGIIRIDFIITKDNEGNDVLNMLEINTTPGMTPTSFIPQQVRAAGLDIKDVMTDIVENQF